MNRVAGQPLFTKNPNCGCIDPNQDLVLNPAAWADVPAGQWGYSAAYYNDYRWQHQASENLNLGRRFPIRERMFLEVRAEFFAFLSNPVAADGARYVGGQAGYVYPQHTHVQINGQWVATGGIGHNPKPSLNWTVAERRQYLEQYPAY